MSELRSLKNALQNYIHKKDYKNCFYTIKRVHAILNSDQKPEKSPNVTYECGLETNIDILKLTLRNDILFLLVNKKHISADIIKLIKELGTEYDNKVKDIICTEIIKSSLLTFTKNNETITSPKGIINSFLMYENILDDLKLNYSHFPFSWNILGEFTHGFCNEMKEILLKSLYYKEWKISDIIEMLEYTINFESKTSQFCFIDCCRNEKKIVFTNSDIIYNNNEVCNNLNNKETLVQTNRNYAQLDFRKQKDKFCEHKKILSRTFRQYYKSYVEHLFAKAHKIEFSRDYQESYIFVCFIDLFRQLSEIVIKIQYFNDKNLYNVLVQISNNYINNLLNKVVYGGTFIESCISLNSLMYTEEAFIDFLMMVTTKTNKCCVDYSCIRNIRRLEKLEYKNMEDHMHSFLKNIFKSKITHTFNQEILLFLVNNFFSLEHQELNESVTRYVMELTVQSLFSMIINIKLDVELSEFLLTEVSELKRSLCNKIVEIPFITTLERYLKIFLISPYQNLSFIENFEMFSNETFNFSQILKVLKEDGNNVELFLDYKKYKMI